MAEARERELHAALNEAQLAYDQHTRALQTLGPQIAGSLQQLRAEESRFVQLWQTLGLKDADPIVSPRLPPPLRAPPERWHSDYALIPLSLVTAQARQVCACGHHTTLAPSEYRPNWDFNACVFVLSGDQIMSSGCCR